MNFRDNTIGEYLRSPMKFYEQMKTEQDNMPTYVKLLGNFEVPDFDFDDLNIQDRTILTKYSTDYGYNDNNAKLDMVEMQDLPKALVDVCSGFDVKLPNLTMSIQSPGNVVPAHVDTWKFWCDRYPKEMEQYTFYDTKFYVWFLSDRDVGHTFQCGYNDINWKKGDLVEIPFYTRHATSNAGYTDKLLIQCLGIQTIK